MRQIKALRAFHNLLVVEKGDNGEPSNFAYEANNPYAVQALRAIERELEVAPTSEGFANLSSVYLYRGDLERAKKCTDKALSQWPDDPAVLAAALIVAGARNDTTAKIHYLERILRIEPDNASLQDDLAATRKQIEQQQQRPD